MPITTTPSGGPQGEFSTYTPIYATTLSATTSTVTFSNIPTTFTDLVLTLNVKNPGAGAGNLQMTFNNDSSSLYSQTNLNADGTSATSGRASTQSVLKLGVVGNTNQTFTGNIFHILNYSNPSVFKTILSRQAWEEGVAARVGLYRSTAPITTITLTVDASNANYSSGSTFTIYGIKAATPAPKATGGDVITTDGTYWYHAFKNSGLFDVKQSLTADVLVVAGGGGGGGVYGNQGAGGGGAGGIFYATSQSLTVSTHSVTVGAGGVGGVGGNLNGGGYLNPGTNGFNSTFGSLTAAVGGGGGGGGSVGSNGGSGGGGINFSLAGGSSTQTGTGGTGYGNAGGTGQGSVNQFGGSGGGAGAAGTGGGAGGVGLNTWSSWASATGTGSSGFYAGGGGTSSSGSTTAGGSGGGGAAASSTSGVNATAGTLHTGGGGGGVYNNSTSANATGGAGGSGIVIVRYPV
jgi:hypothetical protein